VFQAMANQLAAALRGAQSYAETQAAIERADSINRRLTRERWESYLGRVGRGERVGYAYDLQDVRPLSGDTGPLETVPGADNGGGRLHAQPGVLTRHSPSARSRLETTASASCTARRNAGGVGRRLTAPRP